MSAEVLLIQSYGKRLHEAIRARGIRKVYTLATELGVSESAVSRWLKSEPITLENFAKLCLVLDINADWLLFERGGMSTERCPLQSILQVMRDDDVERLARFLEGIIANMPGDGN
jgi:transcriptional regulator with XRE-family HTH domain